MADYRIPGPVCASNRPSIDEGTLVRWCTKPPGPYCSVPEPEPRYWHSHSVQGGFSASTLTMSPKAVALLQSIEALRLKPYDDQTGKAITDWVTGATIGYGHLIKKEDWDTYKDGITRDQADTLFLTDAEPFEKTVGKTIHFGVQQYEFDAMVILAFNIGKAGFQKSTAAKLINQRQEKISNKKPLDKLEDLALEEAWKAYNKSQGKVNLGLQNRRAAEWRIFTSADYSGW